MTRVRMVCCVGNIICGANTLVPEKSPRGIPGFLLNGGSFTEWKVQGKLGGYTACVSYLNSQYLFHSIMRLSATLTKFVGS